jgi:hypothetical protein
MRRSYTASSAARPCATSTRAYINWGCAHLDFDDYVSRRLEDCENQIPLPLLIPGDTDIVNAANFAGTAAESAMCIKV